MSHIRSAMTRSTERSGRAREGGANGRHIEHLSPADRLGPPRFAQARTGRPAAAPGHGKVQAHEAVLTGQQRLAAENPDSDGVLARADVGLVRAAAATSWSSAASTWSDASTVLVGGPLSEPDERLAAAQLVWDAPVTLTATRCPGGTSGTDSL